MVLHTIIEGSVKSLVNVKREWSDIYSLLSTALSPHSIYNRLAIYGQLPYSHYADSQRSRSGFQMLTQTDSNWSLWWLPAAMEHSQWILQREWMFCAITHTARFTIIIIITYFAILWGKNDIVIAIFSIYFAAIKLRWDAQTRADSADQNNTYIK